MGNERQLIFHIEVERGPLAHYWQQCGNNSPENEAVS
jgi:hypothetical protein